MEPTTTDFAFKETAPAAQMHARFSLTETTRISLYFKDDKGQYIQGEGARVKLLPVQGEPFGSATPAGSMEMVLANPAAAALFMNAPINQQYDLLFSPVPAGEK